MQNISSNIVGKITLLLTLFQVWGICHSSNHVFCAKFILINDLQIMTATQQKLLET